MLFLWIKGCWQLWNSENNFENIIIMHVYCCRHLTVTKGQIPQLHMPPQKALQYYMFHHQLILWKSFVNHIMQSAIGFWNSWMYVKITVASFGTWMYRMHFIWIECIFSIEWNVYLALVMVIGLIEVNWSNSMK